MNRQLVTAATYTVAIPDAAGNCTNQGIILDCDSTANAIAITLPAISGFPGVPKFTVIVNDSGGLAATNNITVSCNAADKINNGASVVLNQNGSTISFNIVGITDWSATYPMGGLAPIAITSTSDGSGTGTILNGNVMGTVTSASANNFVILPAPIPGTTVRLTVGANGFKLKSSAPATVAINGGTGSGVSSAIGANVYVELMCNTPTTWIGRQYSTAGVQTAVAVAA